MSMNNNPVNIPQHTSEEHFQASLTVKRQLKLTVTPHDKKKMKTNWPKNQEESSHWSVNEQKP